VAKNNILIIGLCVLFFIIPYEIDLRNLGINIPIINTTLEILSILIIFVWLFNKLKNRQFKIKSTPLDILILIFVIWHFVSMFMSVENPIWALKYIFKLMGGIILFYLIVDTIKTKEQIKNIIFAMLFSGIIVSVIGIFERIAPHVMKKVLFVFCPEQFLLPEGLTLRIKSTFGYPNILAQYLEMVILVFSGIYIATRKKILLVILFILTEALILTYSRGGLIGLFSGLIFILIICYFNTNMRRYFKSVLTIVGVVITLFIGTTVFDKIFTTHLFNTFDSKYVSNVERIYLWQSAVKMIKDHPVFGVGPDNYRWVYAAKYNEHSPFSTMRRTGGGMPNAHSNNFYLETASNLGIVGLGVLLWLIFRIKRSVSLVFKNYDDEYILPIFLGITGAIVAFFAHGLVDDFWQFQSMILMFWMILGLLISSMELLKNENNFQ
jgi:putative inorganic carbon (hco3(-)) transporter